MRTMMALATASLLATTAAGATPTFTFSANPTPTATIGGKAIGYDNFVLPKGASSQTQDLAQNFNGCGPSIAASPNLQSVSSPLGNNGHAIYRFDNTTVAGARLNPYGAGSTNCYMSVSDPSVDQGDPTQTADFHLAGNLAPDPNPNSYTYNRYVGFYWGSVDSYNYIQLFDASGAAILINGITDANGFISGTEIASLAGISVDAAKSVYVNIFFSQTDLFTDIVFGNTQNYAFELTNFASSADPVDGQPAFARTGFPKFSFNTLAVPEPGAALALGAGMGLLGIARRKRS